MRINRFAWRPISSSWVTITSGITVVIVTHEEEIGRQPFIPLNHPITHANQPLRLATDLLFVGNDHQRHYGGDRYPRRGDLSPAVHPPESPHHACESTASPGDRSPLRG